MGAAAQGSLAADGSGPDGRITGPDGGSIGGEDTGAAVAVQAPLLLSIVPPRGPVSGGTIAILTVARWEDTGTIEIGGAEAEVLADLGGGRFTIRTPAGEAGDADLVATTAGGTPGTAVRAFEYRDPTEAGPGLTAMIPAKGPSAGGAPLFAEGEHFASDAIWFLGWRPIPQVQLLNQLSARLVAPALPPGKHTLATTNADGQSAVLDGAYEAIDPNDLGPQPELLGATPSSSSTAGGAVVTVQGDKLEGGSILLVGGTKAVSWKVIDPGKGQFTAPAHDAGLLDLVYSAPDGRFAVLEDALLFRVDAPVIYRVDPASGPVQGGETVTVSGAHLAPGATFLIGGRPCTGAKVADGGKTATCEVPAGKEPGAADLEASNPDGQIGFLPDAYTYLGAPAAPEIDQVAPDTGDVAGGYLAVVSGKHIKPGTKVFFGDLEAAVATTSEGALAVTVPKAAKAGPVDVVFKTTGFSDAALQGGFTYTALGPPELTELVPATGPTTGGIVVLVKGKRLRSGSQVLFGGQPAKTAYVLGPEGIAVLLPKGGEGPIDVVLKTEGLPDVVLKAGFTYKKPAEGPQNLMGVGKVSPASGPTTGGHWAVIEGAQLPMNAKVFFGGGIATEVVFARSDTLTARVPAAAKAGPVDVTVQDPSTLLETTLKGAYTYYDPADAKQPAPALSWLKPAIGPSVGGTMALLSGKGFGPGALIFVAGRPGRDVTVVGAEAASFHTPPGKPGAADVMLVNADGQHAELKGAFVYSWGAKKPVALSSASPSQGTSAGGTDVQLAGKGFAPGLLLFIDGRPAAATLVGPTELRLTTPPHAPGMAAFTVTAPDGWSATLADAFNFIVQAPFIATISPAFGFPEGGTKVVISGQGFHPEAVVLFGGKEAKGLLATNTMLTVRTPPHAKGKVDVTVRNPDFLSDTRKQGFEYTNVVPGKEVSVSAIVPNSSTLAGGGTATVHGTGFGKGTAVIVGTKLAKTTLVDGGALSIEIPAAAAKGAVDLKVVVPGFGDAVLENGFFYYDSKSVGPFPLLSDVWPGVGPTSGGTIALISVSPAPASAKVFVGGLPATVLGADGKSALVVRMPPRAAGSGDVSVIFADGRADTATGAFTWYKPAPDIKPPVLTQVLPTSGSAAGGQSIALTGAGFASPMVAFVGYRPCTGTKVGSDTQLSAVSPPHPAGLSDVAATRNDGLSAVLKGAYGFVQPAPAPDAVFPATGHIDGGGKVVISGRFFAKGAAVRFGAQPSKKVSVIAPHLLIALAPATAKAGKVGVTVINPDQQKGSLPAAYTYFSGQHDFPPPKVLSLVPARGPWQGGTVLAVYGSGFRPGAKVLFSGRPALVHVVEPGLVTVTVPAGSMGPADVTVLNADGQGHTRGAAFSWIATTKPAPALLGITPASGPEKGGTATILTGNHFTGGGLGLVGYRPLAAWTVLNAAIATGTTSPGEAAKQDVVFTGGDGQSAVLRGGFQYVGAPQIDSFEPTMGASAGGTVITLAGKGFSQAAKVTLGGQPVHSVKVLSPFVVKVQTNAHAPGPAQLRIENPDGQAHVAAPPFRFVLPPQITEIFPVRGVSTGGTPLILLGKDFLPGAKVTLDGKPAIGIAVVSPTAITVRTPPGEIGRHAKVRVDNPDGQSALAKQLFERVDATKIGKLPTLLGIAPKQGPTTGGTWGLLVAKDLQEGARLILGTVPARGTEVFDATSARFVTAPAAATSTVDAIVVHPDGGHALLKNAFTYRDPSGLGPAPKVAGIDPDFGPTKGGTKLTLLGSGLRTGSLVFLDKLPAASVAGGKSGGSLVAATPPHPLGPVTVRITNPEGRTTARKEGFTYVPPPKIESISPAFGPAAGGSAVTIKGAHFAAGKDPDKRGRVVFCKLFTASLDCAQVPTAQVDVVSSTRILLTTPKQVPGLSDVALINPDGQVAVRVKGFLFKPPPKILKVAPDHGSTRGDEAIAIEGEGFQKGAVVKIGGATVAAIKSLDAGRIVVLTPKGAPGAAAVTVINPDGGGHTLGGGFTYIAPPAIDNVFPGIGPEQGGTVVTIQGSGFVTGVKGSKVFFGARKVPEKDVQIESAGIIKAKSPAGTGPVALKVVNPDGQLVIKAGGFVYIPKIPPPQPTHLTPAFGLTGGGYLVSVYGKGLLGGAALRFGNKAVGYKYATKVKIYNAGTLIVGVVPAHAPGKYDVVVTNSDGQSGTLADGFEFIAPLGLPGLAFGGVAPNRGPRAGGYTVTVYGQGFKSGVKLYFGKAATASWQEAPKIVRLGPTLLTVTVPKTALKGPVDMRIVNPSIGGKADEVVGKARFVFGQSVVLEAAGHRLPTDLSRGDRQTSIFDVNGDGLNDVFVMHHGARQDLLIQVKDAQGRAGKFIDVSATQLGEMPDRRCDDADLSVVLDVDKDGDLDLIYRSRRYYLCLWRNLGAGKFRSEYKGAPNTGEHRLYEARDLQAADLSCDGIPDLFVATTRRNFVLIGDGKGGYKQDNTRLPTHREPSISVALGDVDRDGDIDALVANDNAVQNRLYYNTCNNVAKGQPWSFKDAQYGSKKNFPVSGFNSQQALLGDLDGDGWLDAMILNRGQSDRVYFNNGGNFRLDDGLHFPQNESRMHTRHGEFVDVDGDGDLDLVTEKYVGNNNHWPAVYLNDKAQGGSGVLADASKINVPAYRGEDVRFVTVGDLDGDKRPDLYLTRVDHQDWLLLNHGWAENKAMVDANRVPIGAFANNTVFGYPEDTLNSKDGTAGDIDGDGDQDLVITNDLYSGRTRIWVNDGAGNFFDETEKRTPDVRCPGGETVLADLNGDGDLDMLMACYNTYGRLNGKWGWRGGGLRELANDGKGYFKDVSKVNLPWHYTGQRVNTVQVGDLDGDGDLDAIVTGYRYDHLVLVNGGDPFGSGGAYFFAKTWLPFPQDRNFDGAVIADLNGDHHPDVYLGRWSGQNVLYHNKGKGTMQNVSGSHLPSVGDETRQVLAADFDFDKDVDLFVVNRGVNRLQVGELDYKFADVTASNLPGGGVNADSTDGVVVDLDRDGYPDIVTATWGAQNRLLLNQGEAQFGDFTGSLPRDNDYSTWVVAADFNGDKVPDLFVGGSGMTRLYLNNTPKGSKK